MSLEYMAGRYKANDNKKDGEPMPEKTDPLMAKLQQQIQDGVFANLETQLSLIAHANYKDDDVLETMSRAMMVMAMAWIDRQPPQTKRKLMEELAFITDRMVRGEKL